MIGRMSHWNYLFDEETMQKQLDIAKGKREFENGKAEGKAEEKISLALNMLKKGKLSIEDIAEYSGLALEKVKELASHTTSAAHV